MTAKVQLLVMANGAPQSTILKATFKSPVQMAESKNLVNETGMTTDLSE